jgi:hypothetical protein
MQMIYKVVKQTISAYLNMVIEDAYRKEKQRAKNQAAFLQAVSIYVNTIDHIKETLGNVSDLIVTLLEAPYNEQVEFNQEEEACLEMINELLVMVKKIAEAGVEAPFNSSFAKINWEKFDDGHGDISRYIFEIRDVLKPLVDGLKGRVTSLHLSKILNILCQLLTSKFVAALLKLKKVSDAGIAQLQRDLGRMKQDLEDFGKNEDGEPVTKIYAKFVQGAAEKAARVIQLLGMHNVSQIAQETKHFREFVSLQEMEKILANKGFKKAEISNILSTYENN